MKNYKLLFVLAGMLSFIFLSGCNGGVNLTVPGAVTAESSGLENGGSDPIPSPTPDPSATPAPSPTPDPSPAPASKNRIFVLNATLKSINTQSAGFFNYACYREARRNRLPGKYVALVATSDAEFSKKHKVNGFIYQKFMGVENRVADSLKDLFDGKNDSIYALANQLSINTSVQNYVWTGQRNMNSAASKDENCQDWTTNTGEAVVGLAGATGSDALAKKMQSCDVFSHLYCVQVDQ